MANLLRIARTIPKELWVCFCVDTVFGEFTILASYMAGTGRWGIYIAITLIILSAAAFSFTLYNSVMVCWHKRE